MDFLEEELKNGDIYHDAINKSFKIKKIIPHEWYFLNLLINQTIKNNSLADSFVMYVSQYYPHYRWLGFDADDYLATVILECGFYRFEFQKKYEFNFIENNNDYFSHAMEFGDIVTDFFIRYCGYSLIKSSDQNIILTSRNDCHKRFEELLLQGYSLQRRSKVGYIEISKILDDSSQYPGVKGVFYKLPVLPTKDMGYPIDEIIEVSEGKYEKVLKRRN